jgi:hypothetical protein
MTGVKLLPRTISALMGSGGKLTAIISVEGRSHAEKPTYSGAFNGLLEISQTATRYTSCHLARVTPQWDAGLIAIVL